MVIVNRQNLLLHQDLLIMVTVKINRPTRTQFAYPLIGDRHGIRMKKNHHVSWKPERRGTLSPQNGDFLDLNHLVILHSHGKSSFSIGKPSMNEPFSMAMLNNQVTETHSSIVRPCFPWPRPGGPHLTSCQIFVAVTEVVIPRRRFPDRGIYWTSNIYIYICR